MKCRALDEILTLAEEVAEETADLFECNCSGCDGHLHPRQSPPPAPAAAAGAEDRGDSRLPRSGGDTMSGMDLTDIKRGPARRRSAAPTTTGMN